jgi:hypothetical protein
MRLLLAHATLQPPAQSTSLAMGTQAPL